MFKIIDWLLNKILYVLVCIIYFWKFLRIIIFLWIENVIGRIVQISIWVHSLFWANIHILYWLESVLRLPLETSHIILFTLIKIRIKR